ncbi:Vacuolar protein-sorting-associated protein 24 [Malassezia vespertilionis]|uniref:Vps24p n=1 Tax=Malassezia vespertilionis TaxID=2020962 RepID=A0A2N1JE15_9BASI|nr:Vacuolar protein-sorting-associated protein 24 [Malassezia vespertilionis]PKI84788.1 Vps24p [Malassezia vespertilionis]WFD05927.1 Vacuolar protein-sorting-associated protein 24 [Malassezia vespertilionis]
MQSLSRLLYGPSKEDRIREVQRRLRTEQRSLDREIRQIDQSTGKVKADIKRLARKGDTKNATMLAREVVRSTKHRTRLVTSKAQLNSIALQLQQQMAMFKVTGTLQKSTEIMRLSNSVLRLPQMSQSMREMSSELTKAGILEEMMNDTLDAGMLGDDAEELEEEAQAEVNSVLHELTDGKLGAAAPASTLPALDTAHETQDMEQMQAQLDVLLRGEHA